MMLFFVIARERGQIKPEVRELFCLPPNLGLSVGTRAEYNQGCQRIGQKEALKLALKSPRKN